MHPSSISLASTQIGEFSSQKHSFVTINGFLRDPESIIESANLQRFAEITPQYPGLRAPLDPGLARDWLAELTPLLDQAFGPAPKGWDMQAWYSIVTTPPAQLLPIQRLPHVDGTDPGQIALMLYLSRTAHGGTAFFRHKATGFEALTAANYPHYARTLQAEVNAAGLPAPRYVTTGAPHFERVHATEGNFNQAVLYRGNVLHSGVIDNDAPLPADPHTGRLTINAFFGPK
jgi:hypothetical protein